MLDPRLLRTDPEAVAAQSRASRLPARRRRGYARSRSGARRRRSRRTKLRAARNAHAKTVGKAKAQGQDIAPLLAEGEALGGELRDALEHELAAVQREFDELAARPAEHCCTRACRTGATKPPTSKCAAGARRARSISRRSTTSRSARSSALIDFEAAGRISGARFVVLKRGIARLHRALDPVHARPAHAASTATPRSTCRTSCCAARCVGTGQLPKFEADLFRHLAASRSCS